MEEIAALINYWENRAELINSSINTGIIIKVTLTFKDVKPCMLSSYDLQL